jgi:fumarate hydratase subunit alpha
MREVNAEQITETVAQLCIDMCYHVSDDFLQALERAVDREESDTGREIMGQILENAKIAKEEGIPACQDTGYTVVFADIGQDCHVVGGDLSEAIHAGVRKGYTEGLLRKSIVGHPLERVNTRDNTPAFIHTRIVPGDRFKVTVAAKGGGSENMSRLAMLKPSQGIEGVKNFVIQAVKEAGPNACPPVIVGVGVGGDFEVCAELAKRAILRPVGQPAPHPADAKLEEELMELINQTGVGPGGFGGKVTALAVHVESFPTHIVSLPVSVNMQCHSSRHKEAVL